MAGKVFIINIYLHVYQLFGYLIKILQNNILWKQQITISYVYFINLFTIIVFFPLGQPGEKSL